MFYERLQEACKKNNIKITVLIRELGLSTSNGTSWKSGVIPNGKTIQLLADRLGVSVSWLLGEDVAIQCDVPTVSEIKKKCEDLTEEEAIKAKEYLEFLISQRKNSAP